MRPDARVAVYYAPRPDDALFADAAAWLGRDPASGAPVPQPDIADIAEVTAEPRLYGFHATLKPPMRLAAGRTLARRRRGGHGARRSHRAVRSAAALGAGCVRLPRIARDRAQCAVAGAGRCLRRAARSRSARRHPRPSLRAAGARISPPRQDAMLVRWGYPYVFDTWFFHLTLTRRLSAGGEAGVHAGRRDLLCPRDRDTAPGHRHLPVRAARSWRTVRHPGTPDAARLRHRDKQVMRQRVHPSERIG